MESNVLGDCIFFAKLFVPLFVLGFILYETHNLFILLVR